MTNFFTTTQWCIIVYMVSSIVCMVIIKDTIKLLKAKKIEMPISEKAESMLKKLPFIPIANTIYASFVIIVFLYGLIFKK